MFRNKSKSFENFMRLNSLDYFTNTFISEYSKCAKEQDFHEKHVKALIEYIDKKSFFAELAYPYDFHKNDLEDEPLIPWSLFNERVRRIFGSPNGVDTSDSRINTAVLYNIIKQGGNLAGPKRGIFFARDFNLDVNIPVKYFIDLHDPNRHEVLEFLLNHDWSNKQLDLEMVCFLRYFYEGIEMKGIKLKDAILGDYDKSFLLRENFSN